MPFQEAAIAIRLGGKQASGVVLMMKRVLLVDDSPEVCAAMKELLPEEEFIVDVAENGLQALWRLKVSAYDAVVTDLMMPIMGGSELKRTMDRWGIETPVLLISAEATVERWAEELGAAEYLRKPFGSEDFLDHLERLLEEGRSAPPC